MTLFRQACLVLLACATFSATAQTSTVTQALPWTEAELRATARQYLADRHARGVALAVVTQDHAIVVGEGESGNAQRTQVDGDTRFEIGSITKVFTAALLAQLIEEGKLHAETPISALMPPPAIQSKAVGEITLAQLASHSSGLPRLPVSAESFSRALLGRADPYRGTQVQDIYDYVRQYQADDAFNKRRGTFDYSNLAVALLGRLLEGPLGMPYERAIEARILKPLQINAAVVAASADEDALLATAHRANLQRTSHWALDAFAPAGYLRLSVNDLVRVAQSNLRGENVFPLGMRVPQVTLRGSRNAVGLGWVIRNADGGNVFWHNGGTGGFRTHLAVDTVRGFAVIVFANAAAESVDQLGAHLLNRDKAPMPSKPTMSLIDTFITLAIPALMLLGGVMRWRRDRRGGEGAVAMGRGNLLAGKPAQSRWDLVLWALNTAIGVLVVWKLGAWQMLPAWAMPVILLAMLVPFALVLPGIGALPWRSTKPLRVTAGIAFALLVLLWAAWWL